MGNTDIRDAAIARGLALGRKFEIEDLVSGSGVDNVLFAAAVDYARSYQGNFDFMLDMRRAANGPRGLSVAQAKGTLNVLMAQARRDAAPKAPTTSVGSVKGIVDLLETAAQHLKHPAVIVRANGCDVRLSIAGAASKAPGSINVCSAEGGFGDREWYGRISRSGEFEPSRRHSAETLDAIGAALQVMAADPAKAASAYGLLTGVCCFCHLPLTDERSTAVGYGKTCAGHYGLPYPTMSEVKAKAA